MDENRNRLLSLVKWERKSAHRDWCDASEFESPDRKSVLCECGNCLNETIRVDWGRLNMDEGNKWNELRNSEHTPIPSHTSTEVASGARRLHIEMKDRKLFAEGKNWHAMAVTVTDDAIQCRELCVHDLSNWRRLAAIANKFPFSFLSHSVEEISCRKKCLWKKTKYCKPEVEKWHVIYSALYCICILFHSSSSSKSTDFLFVLVFIV